MNWGVGERLLVRGFAYTIFVEYTILVESKTWVPSQLLGLNPQNIYLTMKFLKKISRRFQADSSIVPKWIWDHQAITMSLNQDGSTKKLFSSSIVSNC